MDHFGIGAALQGVANVYFLSARRTGRTTSLLESLKDGDRVVCPTADIARHLGFECRDRKLKVECVVIPPDRPQALFERGTSEGRTLFEHTWVERFYMVTLAECARAIDNLQRQSSGYGTAHVETRRRAEEIARWREWTPPEEKKTP